MMFKYDKIVIGIDQSYKNCGITVAADGQIKKVTSLPLERFKSNSERRAALRDRLDKILGSIMPKGRVVICIIERIRLHSQGFLNIDYIKSIGALNSIIVDVCFSYDVPVFSVDTRCWKSQVIGTSKPCENAFGVPPEKWPTVKWVIEKGFESCILMEIFGRKTKGTFVKNEQKFMYNNDAADSAGIAMFGFIGDPSKLQKEK